MDYYEFDERERIMTEWLAAIEKQEKQGKYRPSIWPIVLGFIAAAALIALVAWTLS